MDTTHSHNRREAPPARQSQEQGNSGSRGKWVFLGFAAIAGFFLFTEHRAHLFGILPYLLLACPLMHLFHRGGPTEAEP